MKAASHTGVRKQINVSDPKTIESLVSMQELYDEVLKRKVSFSVLFARAISLMEEHAAGLEASKEDTSREVRLIDALTAYRH